MSLTKYQKFNLLIIALSLITLVVGLSLVWFASSKVEKEPEIVEGSEQWCDLMLYVPNDQWQERDFTLFGKHCLDPQPLPSRQ